MYFNLPNMQYFLGHVTTTKITVKRPIKLQSTNYDCKNSLQRSTAKGRPVIPTTFNRIFCKWINNINLQRASYLYQITVAKKEDEGYLGTTKVPTELLLIKWLITLPTIETGGTSQLFSPDQSDVKASTPMEPGFQYKELSLSSLALFILAKLYKVPTNYQETGKNQQWLPNSLMSIIRLRISTLWFSILKIHIVCISIL